MVTRAPDLFDFQDGDHPFDIKSQSNVKNKILCLRHIKTTSIIEKYFPLGSGLMMGLYRLTTLNTRGAKRWYGVRISGQRRKEAEKFPL